MSKNNGKVNYRRPAKGRNRANRPERRITVRSVRREPYDLRPLGRAAIAAALAEAQATEPEAPPPHTDESTLAADSQEADHGAE
ncbi:hypothetical protein [Nocardia sp. CC201C]|uniref:hypothetical protein n=1 Tax=Nocardia sp. CC201C TaxID=3044575 RepID=UPI0024A91A4F|nr:hypothetical protein [Nocardia sp. CC201C]